jgi:energy-coupling factor transport system permease protein
VPVSVVPPEIRLLLYVAFAASLFIFPVLKLYAALAVLLMVLLAFIPRRTLVSGWLPISLFLLFTFMSNLLGRPGRVLMTAGPLVVTDGGLQSAALRGGRLLLMIMGVKLMMGLTPAEDVIKGLGRLLKPLERLGLPVSDFIHTMILTLQCFPALKDMAADLYRKKAVENNARGFWGRARTIAGFLMPLFVRSMRNPEAFFETGGEK